MGILRADRVSGLGGANASKGSAFFAGNGSFIQVDPSSDLSLANNDFTVEMFINFIGFDSSGFDTIMMRTDVADQNTSTFQFDYKNSTSNLRFVFYVSNSSVVYESSWSPDKDRWYHIAACRSGSNLKLFVDGTQIGSTHDVGSSTMDSDLVPLHIGRRAGNNQDRELHGYLSNLRIINGSALYTSNFTAPNGELTKTSDTVLLCFQSSNVLKEETDKKLDALNDSLNDAPVSSSRFTPNSPVGFSTTTDVGTQFGSTFDGVTTFDSQAYMLPPGGNTRERNRGRGLLFGGYSTSPAGHVSTIQSIEIHSFGNAQDFGDLTSIRSQIGGVSSKTRAISCGGGNDTPSAYTPVNICEFVTIANSSNTTDFGDLTVSRTPYKASSNDTRGIIFGGYAHPSNLNTIDFITIATAGNATDFGDEIDTNRAGGSCSSTTRGIVAGGFSYTNRISFVTIATTGDAQEFGDLLNDVFGTGGVSNNTRGVFGGGGNAPNAAAINVIQFITMASTGDATDFGDLNTTEKVGNRGTSNSIRGLFCGGYDGATFVNSISAINIATTGNAVDFGDISGTLRFASAVSDSHGGLE